MVGSLFTNGKHGIMGINGLTPVILYICNYARFGVHRNSSKPLRW